MDVEYKGQHSIIFYKDVKNGYLKKNSWTHFHMIPASRPYVALGEPGISYVPIPGTSKRVDITDYSPGGLTFGGRTGSWEFYIDHTKWPSWVDAESTIREYIHGGTFLINLKDDPNIAYKGILTVSGYVAGQNYSKITIQYDLMNDTVTMEEEHSYGDFGTLPDPTYVDGGLDLDGDGEKDTELAENHGYDFNCDGVLDYITVPSSGAALYEPQPYISWEYAIGSGVVEVANFTIGGQQVGMWAILDPLGVYGLDTDCDGYVDFDLSRYSYVDVTDLNIKPSMLPPGTLPKDKWQWITDGDIITGLDVTGDGKPDFDLIIDENNQYQLVPHRDPVTEEPTMDPNNPQPSQIEIPSDDLPSDAKPKDQWEWTRDENGDITGIDVSGDGKPDFDLVDNPDGGKDIVKHHDPINDTPVSETDVEAPKPSQIDIPSSELPPDAKPKDQWEWTRDENGDITGIDVTGDGKPDFDLVDNPDGGKDIVKHHDPINDTPISETDVEAPKPSQIDIPSGDLPSDAKPKDQWEWTTGDDGEKTGIDVTGDGKPDFDLRETPDGTYNIVPHEEPVNEEPIPTPKDPEPGDLPIKQKDLPTDAKPKDQWEWTTGDDGEKTGVDVTGDGKPDFDLRKNPDGTYNIVPHEEPVNEEPAMDPNDPKPSDLKIKAENLPDDALPKDQWEWTRDENGTITGIDVTGDGEPDFDLRKKPDGTVEVVPHGSNEPATEEPLPEPSKLPDFEELDIPEKTVKGWDTDCDGIVDIPVDLNNPIPPKYIRDEETQKILGLDLNGDNEIDIYVTDHDKKHKVSEGLEGLDTDCDGEWNVQTYWPIGEEPTVFGDYYPLQFVFLSGDTSNQYGMKTVSQSGKTFGVYDVYTIYEKDVVSHKSQQSGGEDEVIIDQYARDASEDIIFTG